MPHGPEKGCDGGRGCEPGSGQSQVRVLATSHSEAPSPEPARPVEWCQLARWVTVAPLVSFGVGCPGCEGAGPIWGTTRHFRPIMPAPWPWHTRELHPPAWPFLSRPALSIVFSFSFARFFFFFVFLLSVVHNTPPFLFSSSLSLFEFGPSSLLLVVLFFKSLETVSFFFLSTALKR